MTGNSVLIEEYISRINRVINYIDANLSGELSLEKIASVAHFSPFHFHRIFSAFMNESLFHYIKRLRIERAADYLVLYREKTISEIAWEFGFSGPATFARSFREFFNMSAGDWRKGGHLNYRKNSKKDGLISKNPAKKSIKKILDAYYIRKVFDRNNIAGWNIEIKGGSEIKAHVQIKELPDLTVAYVRHFGSYFGNSELFAQQFGKLFGWAGPRGLLNQTDFTCLSVYYDNPAVTDDDKLRLDVCLKVPPETEVSGEVGLMQLRGGQYAVARFESLEMDSWPAVLAGWLPQSGYQPDDKPCFEIYLNNPEDNPEHKCSGDICIPVKPF